MKKLVLVSLVLIICSCSPGLKIQKSYQADDIDFNHLKNSTITLGGVNSISLSEFINTFNDEYSDSTKLDNKIENDFTSQFYKLIPSVTTVKMSEKFPSFLTGELSFKENRNEEASEFFKGLQTDYLLFINNIDVGNAYNSYVYSTGGNTMATGQTENCVVNIEVELWDVMQQKRIMKFRAGGEKSVVLFSYLAALDDAIENSVITAVEYIKNDGKLN